MIRRHSTRLSQAHDEEPEDDQGQHTATRDYPELGTVLDDRPDPGRQITVIGMHRRADAYGTAEDPRSGEYNGGEQDLGMYWAEPGQQAWKEEHLGPQEEAPPPLYDPDMMPPAMARLAALEEAQAFFGMSHHATTINGTQVDDAGDAPQHGTVPRAEDPDSYDDASHEGEGDGKWDDPLPWGSKDDENAATVGMYPEGISSGSGPGISVGPFTAALSPEEAEELRRHVAGDHAFPVQDGYGDAALAAIHEGLHMAGHASHEHGDDYETDPGWDGRDAGGYHQFAGMRREARVPWTGKERGSLHRWQEEPTATWGDFVPSSDFPLLKPGEHVSHEDQGEGIGEVEGAWRQLPLGRFQAAFNVHVRIDGKELHGHDDDQEDDRAPQHEHDDPGSSLDSDADNSQDKNGLDNEFPQVSKGTPQDRTQDGPPVSPADPDDPMNDPGNWPQAGADVSERSRAYTQGSGDGKVTRGGAPAPFSPDDGDSGGGGDQGDDAGDGDQPDDAGTPFSKDGALAMFTAAAGSPSFRFEFTAAWHDVVAKAKRIRAEGHVRIVHATRGMVIGEVRGDHDIYESGIQRPVGKRQTIQHWACGCPWASFHQDKTAGTRYAGRPCSHVMALQFEAQSRGMFGRAPGTDTGAPSWAPETVVVKSWPPYEGEPHAGRWREEWRAPLARHTGAPGHGAPSWRATAGLLRAGEDPGAVGALRLLAGLRATADQASAPWGSDNVAQHPPQKPYGATSPPNKDQDPGSYGPLAGPDPENWGGIVDNSYVQSPLSNEASSHYCLVPGARILTKDLRWQPIELLEPGEEIVAFDESQVPGATGRKFRTARVESSSSLVRPCVRIILDDGTSVIASTDHRWLVNSGRNTRWASSSRLRPGTAVYSLGTWEVEDSREAGWLAGMYDGEGWVVSGTPERSASRFVGISQNEGPTADRLREALKRRDFEFDDYDYAARNPKWRTNRRFHITGGISEQLRLLGTIRPERLVEKAERIWVNRQIRYLKMPVVVSVDPVGEMEVIAVKTDYGTFIAEGLLSHNCSQMPSGDDEMIRHMADDHSVDYSGVRFLEPGRWHGILHEDHQWDHDHGLPDEVASEMSMEDEARYRPHEGPIDPVFGSAYQMPLSNTAAHQVLVPGAPHPQPGDLHWPAMNGWQAEDQGTFGYTDRASTAGPSTAMDPRDPDGIRMEEARRATAAGTPFPYHGTVPQLDGALAELHDEPEPALPSVTGDDGEDLRAQAGIDGTMGDAQDVPHGFTASRVHGGCALCGLNQGTRVHAAADGTIGGGDAGTGTGQGAAADEAALGEFGAARELSGLSGRMSPDESGPVRSGLRTKFGGTPMGDLGRETWPQAQQPSPVGQNPGMGSMDEPLMPDDQSIQTIGNQQWSGGGADSDEAAVEPGQPQGSIDDIVASFQRSAAARGLSGGAGPGQADGDIAVAARRYLAKTAEALPQAEADELVREGAGSRARNLDLLRLEGTHYEDEDDELAKRGLSLDGYDDDVIFA